MIGVTSLDWTQECRDAFNALKQALLGRVVLAHPNFDKPFLLSVDASSNGLGAVLSQVAEGEEVARPIAFASKSLNYAQSKYPAHRLEFFALKWAVCEKFSHWLRGQQFSVWTDNNPLTYILTKPKLDACEQRWVAKLAPYKTSLIVNHLVIKQRRVKHHVDGQSRSSSKHQLEWSKPGCLMNCRIITEGERLQHLRPSVLGFRW